VLIAVAEGWQRKFLRGLGSRFVFPSDEIYLLAGRPMPAADAYEGFAIAEDGIGLVRRFIDEYARAAARMKQKIDARKITVVTGELFAPILESLLAGLRGAATRPRIAAVPNEFFGRRIGVAGLLTGQDIQRHLSRLDDLGDEVLVPGVTVRDGDGVFLDDVTPDDLARDLGVRIRVIPPEPAPLLRAVFGA
jgi:NifB/MoaA-like Fe-S oxidoreductase